MRLTRDTHQFNHIYRAEVKDNNDPRQLGRIKVWIDDVFQNIDVSLIPWAVPAMPVFTGAGNDYGCFDVPEVGSWVFVFFEAGDLYQPVYFLSAPNAVHGLPTERITNYPSRHVKKTKSGIVIYIDDADKVVRLTHPTGKYIEMDGNGNVVVEAENVTIQASGEVNVSATGNVTISGAVVDLNP